MGGLASGEIAHVFLRYLTGAGATREWPAALIRLRQPLAGRLGIERPVSYFVGEIPADADTCRPMRMEGRAESAELVAGAPVGDAGVFADGVALPGSDACTASAAAELGGKMP